MGTSRKPKQRWILRLAAAVLLLLTVWFLDSMGFSILLVPVTGDAMD
jgi:hypothetical protein